MADLKLNVPQKSNELFDISLVVTASVTIHKNKKIDVRVRMKFASTIAPDGD
jgi:hypothetical protein